MIHVQHTRRQKKIVFLAVLAALFVLLLGGYFLAKALTPETPEEDDTVTIEADTELGESVYGNSAIAYDHVESDAISEIDINYSKQLPDESYTSERYSFVRSDNNFFVLYIADELFAPEILAADSEFDYTSIYAIEQDDGFGKIMKLTYLCVAIGTPYFAERIALPTESEERSEMLREFGLTRSKATVLSFSYDDSESESGESSHTLVIGDSAVNGAGFYFLVDDRDYIYYTTSSYFSYADAPVESFVQPYLVSAGLSTDSAMEPYLTPDFRQYKNTMHEEGTVEANSDLVIRAAQSSVISQGTKVNSGITDSYNTSSPDDYAITLSNKKLNSYFTGKEVGDYSANPFYYTEVTDSNVIDFGENTSSEFSYTITAVESIITDSEEIRTPGTAVSSYPNAKLLVTYYATQDGVSLNQFETILSSALTSTLPLHAVIDLADTRIEQSVRDALASTSVGDLSSHVSFTKTYYTADTDNLRDISLLIEGISYIADADNNIADTASDGCTVSYSYYEVVDGEKVGTLSYGGIVIGAESDELSVALSSALQGQKCSNHLNISVPVYSCHTEYLQSPTVYQISEISYYCTSEEVVAFKFVNASDRDPYYGETFYTNTMSSEYSLYGLNTSSCEAVVKKVGGIGNTSNSSASSSDGLFGTETVKVGLTPKVLKDYGLYAYTVNFALPRGITTIELENDEDNDALSEYTWSNVLYFTLYVSEKKFDTETESYYRYAASDLYDVVVKIDADEFLFLDYDFLSFYARRNLIMLDIDNVEEIDIDFMMEDLTGSYQMDVEHNLLYYRSEGGKLKTYTEKQYSLTDQNGNTTLYPSREAIAEYLVTQGYTEEKAQTIAENCNALASYDFMNILVTPSYGDSSSAFTDYLDEKGYISEGKYKATSLYEFYRYAVNDGVAKIDSSGIDDISVSYFKEIFNMIYSGFYAGQMSEEDQDALASSSPVFRMTLSVKNQSYQYVYEFYRTADRRYSVKLTKKSDTSATSVASFYVSSFTAKRYIGAFNALLNGEGYDSESLYVD